MKIYYFALFVIGLAVAIAYMDRVTTYHSVYTYCQNAIITDEDILKDYQEYLKLVPECEQYSPEQGREEYLSDVLYYKEQIEIEVRAKQ